MTRKDYRLIALTVRAYNSLATKPRLSDDLAEVVADVLSGTFGNFDREKFIKEASRDD